MKKIIVCILFLLAAFPLLYGCSRGNSANPLSATSDGKSVSRTGGHYTWGLWQFAADPAAQKLDVIPLRAGNFHLNALTFLEPPPLVNLTLESLKFTGNIIDANIGLRHPFSGLIEFTGFDVCGIFITNGSITGFNDTALRMAGNGDTRLLNPDGYSRWWNPTEFPVNDGTMFAYKDGLLGSPDSIGNYNCTLNAYKYFADGLGPDDPVANLSLAHRGMFSAGKKNIRHYKIDMTAGLIFNYAVDACWKFPTGPAPWSAPDDFDIDANRAEARNIVVNEIENTLYNDGTKSGGGLKLDIDVYDWFNADMNTVRVESPGNFTMVESSTLVGGGAGFSTYEVDIATATPAMGEIDLLISVVSEETDFQGFITGTNSTSYFVDTVAVSSETPAQWTIVFSDEGVLPEQKIDFNDISPALSVETDGDIKMAYNVNQPIDYAGTAYSYACKSSDGLNWYNFWCAISSGGGMWACHGDETKILADPAGNSWRTIHLYSQTTDEWATPFTQSTDNPYDCAITSTYISRQPEIVQDADGYIYLLGDRNNMLQFKKSEVPNSLDDGPSGQYWSTFPVYNIGAGYFSRARSCERAPNGTMYFVYYVNDSANVIRLAYNTDSTGLIWNTSTIVYDGSATGTTGAHDPGLDIDPSGEFHVTFVRVAGANNQLCYVHSTDCASWTNPVVIAEMPGTINDDPICFFKFSATDFLATVWRGGTHIYISFSYDGGETWAEAAQVDSLMPQNVQPDFVVTADGVMHIAWAAKNDTYYDIHYRNAWLEEQ